MSMKGIETLEQTLDSIRKPSPRILQQWIAEQGLTAEVFKDDVTEPKGLPYGRTCLFRSNAAEIVLVHLPPGAQTWIHDHGRSIGCALVLEGTLSNCIYGLDAYGFPQLKKQTALTADEYFHAPRGQIHQMKNNGPLRTVSLHVYAPALAGTHMYYAYEDALDFVI